MSLLSMSLRDGDWVKLRQILQHISHLQLGVNSTPTFAGLTLNELTVSKTCELAAGLNVLRVTGLQVDGTAMTGTLRGAYIDVSNGSTAATGTIRALELKARTEAPGDIGNDVNVLEGLSISADSKDHSVTTMRAAEFILDGSTGGTITEAVGLRIANNLQANKATTSYGLQIYRDSFDYTADIQLSGGGTIGGSSGVMQLSSAGLLEVISTAGAQLRLSYDDILYATFEMNSSGNLILTAEADWTFNCGDDFFCIVEDECQFRTGGEILFRSEGNITFKPSDDTNDYIRFQTVADVPEITTIGVCDLKITASSGEIDFDNENLTTTGNISGGTANFGDGGVTNYAQFAADGDLTFVGTAGLPFGSCYGNHIGWSQASAVQNTWYNISDADMVDGNLNNVTHDGNGKLTVTSAGMYFVSYSCCFEDNVANDHVEIGIEVTGSGSANAAGQVHLENKFASEEEHSSSSAILDLAASATLEIAIRTTDVGTPTISVQAVNLTCIQIGGT